MVKYYGEEGQGLMEYALIFALVIIILIVVLALLGPAISNLYAQTINIL